MYKFLIFDIKDFHPSIKEILPHEASQLAKMHVNITKRDMKVVFHSKERLLGKGIPWVKNERNDFDVTMELLMVQKSAADTVGILCKRWS